MRIHKKKAIIEAYFHGHMPDEGDSLVVTKLLQNYFLTNFCLT